MNQFKDPPDGVIGCSIVVDRRQDEVHGHGNPDSHQVERQQPLRYRP